LQPRDRGLGVDALPLGRRVCYHVQHARRRGVEVACGDARLQSRDLTARRLGLALECFRRLLRLLGAYALPRLGFGRRRRERLRRRQCRTRLVELSRQRHSACFCHGAANSARLPAGSSSSAAAGCRRLSCGVVCVALQYGHNLLEPVRLGLQDGEPPLREPQLARLQLGLALGTDRRGRRGRALGGGAVCARLRVGQVGARVGERLLRAQQLALHGGDRLGAGVLHARRFLRGAVGMMVQGKG
jgi:hypothetical protein